ncbi:hypothetical protein N2152v2_003787 [Parachlorella kessleri]
MAPKVKQPRQALKDQLLDPDLKEDKENKINLGDTGSLKRALDDLVVEFYPLKYPASFWLLASCVCTYATLSTGMTYIAAFLERDAIAFTKPNSKKAGTALLVGSKLPRFQDEYHLRIQLRGAEKGREEVSLKKSVAAYFDSAGHVVADAIRADFRALLQRFEAECLKIRKAE